MGAELGTTLVDVPEQVGVGIVDELEAADSALDPLVGVADRATQRSDSFRSAQDIHEELHRSGDGIGLTTVYRTLQAMADSGEVDVLRTANGEAVYRRCATAEHHHHLVCRRCGATVEIEGPAVETWAQNVAEPTDSPSSRTPRRSSGCAAAADRARTRSARSKADPQAV